MKASYGVRERLRQLSAGRQTRFGEVFPEVLTPEQAEHLLSADLERIEFMLNADVPCEQAEFDEAVMIAYRKANGLETD